MPPGQAAKFGIDGDLRSDERQNGNFTAAGSHDWFKKAGGTGLGLIDTTGAAVVKSQIKAGANVAFSRKMQFPRYSVQDGVLMMDATYSRDYSGNDRTAFSGNSTKNTASPMQWGTSLNGGNVSDKTDIIDTYVSMRRNGTSINSANPSNLIATMALTTMATAGDHYADFEFYKERINYNPVTGNFENAGPAATGGHSVWEFNPDGSIRSWGDLTISFSFNNSSVSDIKILIWVSKAAYASKDPKNFDFIVNEFYESASVNGYGYAAIKPNGNGQAVTWGTVNSSTTSAPVWGSNSKELGIAGSNYFSDTYSAGQLAEAAVDLTNLGIDPATFANTNACNPPFTRFMAKSRSSSSFSSSLSDFTGPYEFLDAPTIPADIAEPANLTCAATSVRLEPASFFKGGYYNWTTADGSITKLAPDVSYVEVNKAGTYYLTAAMASGCLQTFDSVVVAEDRIVPEATASASSPVIFPGTGVTLFGNAVLHNTGSVPGGVTGVSWKWEAVGGTSFISSLQNPVATQPGTYRLIVTETRSGCKDTALVSLAPGSVLPMKFTDFTANADRQRKVNALSWKMADAGAINLFEVEKSFNGVDFRTAAYVFADLGFTAYTFNDKASDQTVYYRIKAIGKAGEVVYSDVAKAIGSSAQVPGFAAYNDGKGHLVVNLVSPTLQVIQVALVNMNGQVVKKLSRTVAEGNNSFSAAETAGLAPGIYVLQVLTEGDAFTAKVRL